MSVEVPAKCSDSGQVKGRVNGQAEGQTKGHVKVTPEKILAPIPAMLNNFH